MPTVEAETIARSPDAYDKLLVLKSQWGLSTQDAAKWVAAIAEHDYPVSVWPQDIAAYGQTIPPPPPDVKIGGTGPVKPLVAQDPAYQALNKSATGKWSPQLIDDLVKMKGPGWSKESVHNLLDGLVYGEAAVFDDELAVLAKHGVADALPPGKKVVVSGGGTSAPPSVMEWLSAHETGASLEPRPATPLGKLPLTVHPHKALIQDLVAKTGMTPGYVKNFVNGIIEGKVQPTPTELALFQKHGVVPGGGGAVQPMKQFLDFMGKPVEMPPVPKDATGAANWMMEALKKEIPTNEVYNQVRAAVGMPKVNLMEQALFAAGQNPSADDVKAAIAAFDKNPYAVANQASLKHLGKLVGGVGDAEGKVDLARRIFGDSAVARYQSQGFLDSPMYYTGLESPADEAIREAFRGGKPLSGPASSAMGTTFLRRAMQESPELTGPTVSGNWQLAQQLREWLLNQNTPSANSSKHVMKVIQKGAVPDPYYRAADLPMALRTAGPEEFGKWQAMLRELMERHLWENKVPDPLRVWRGGILGIFDPYKGGVTSDPEMWLPASTDKQIARGYALGKDGVVLNAIMEGKVGPDALRDFAGRMYAPGIKQYSLPHSALVNQIDVPALTNTAYPNEMEITGRARDLLNFEQKFNELGAAKVGKLGKVGLAAGAALAGGLALKNWLDD
jgi:hypothetical protein